MVANKSTLEAVSGAISFVVENLIGDDPVKSDGEAPDKGKSDHYITLQQALLESKKGPDWLDMIKL